MSNKIILILGDKPSKLNEDPKVPFIGAKCYTRLTKWIEYLNLNGQYYISNSDTIEDYLTMAYIDTFKPIVLALGNNAYKKGSKFMTNSNLYRLDHPSGLNRKLNDKNYELKMLEECKKWLDSKM